MTDGQYKNLNYKCSSIKHHYGENVYILNNPYWLSLLNSFSVEKYQQPLLNIILNKLYTQLIAEAMGTISKLSNRSLKTRMSEITPKAVVEGQMIDQKQKFICVDLARAGILPSQTCFESLSLMVDPLNVRQDHFYVNRKVDESNKVIGVDASGSKIGGAKENSWVLFPDPMGATGGSLSYAVGYYKEKVQGKALGYIALHLIVTPEYIARMQKDHPDVKIFTLRLDRGLSSPDVLDLEPGKEWEKEVGLTDTQYIVPGAGGVGELLNNSYV